MATYTVTYDGMDPVRVVAVCDTATAVGAWPSARTRTSPRLPAREELIGVRVRIGSGTFRPA